MTELKSCPFCGKKVQIWQDAELIPQGVACHYCKMVVRFTRVKAPGSHEAFERVIDDIAERWNRREGQDGRFDPQTVSD